MTERARIVVPTEGVRKDISPLITQPTQMRDAVNVMVYKGTVRPRPAMTRQGFSAAVTNWVDTVDAKDAKVFSVFKQHMIYMDNDSNWFFSIDKGTTWLSCTVSGYTGIPVRIINLRGTNSIVLINSVGGVFRADVTLFPTPSTITFVSLGSADFMQLSTFDHTDPWFYDETNDILWFQNYKMAQWQARIHGIKNASTVTSGTWSANYAASERFPFTQGFMSPPKLTGYSDDASDEACWCITSIESIAVGPYFAYLKLDWTNMQGDGDGDMIIDTRWLSKQWFAKMVETNASTYAAKGLRGRGLVSFTYTPDNTTPEQPALTLVSQDHQGAQFRDWVWADSTSEIIVGRGNVRTDDSWTNETRYEDFPSNPNYILAVHAFEGGNSFYFVEELIPYSNGELRAWTVHGQAGPTGVAGDPAIGNTLSIFQGDLDIEPSALFMATTKKLLHLDRATNIWEDFTSAVPAYQPNGDENSNRWVWRQVEKSGDRYIIATNGQIVPQAYSDGLSGFRPVGDENENGIIDGSEAPAPIAKCMAVSNNRLLLGNLSADTEYSIRISDPQNFDTGYSVEYKLADTTGEIVSMKELNALTVAIIKSDAIYHGISQVEFMGVSAPMRFEMIKAGIVGPCSDASVVYLPDGRLCWMGRDGGVYIYDGTVPRDAGRHIRHMVYPLIDTDRFGWVWGMVDTKRNLLWFFFPTKTQPYGMNTGICMSIDQGETWPCWMVQYPLDWEVMSGLNVFRETDLTYGDFPRTPYGDMAVTPYSSFEGGHWEILVARRNNTVYEQVWGDAADYTDGGYPIYVQMDTGWYDFDDLYSFDTFHEMHHLMSLYQGEELNWTLYSEQSDGTELESNKTLQSSNKRHRTSYRQTGRRHRFRMYGYIQRLFDWGGADCSFSRRGGR